MREIRILSSRTLALLILATWSPSASAVFFEIDGVVTTCDAFACGLADIAVDDPVTGFLEVDDAAGGPNSTFVETDILSWRVLVGMVGGTGTGPPDAATLNTDAAGEIETGTILIITQVDAGIFGTADVDIVADAGANSWSASTDLLGLGEVASGTIGFTRCVAGVDDTDGDCIDNTVDNCLEVSNPIQLDTNGDGFGNRCDPDLNNDGIVNPIDLGLFRSVFFTADPDADFNGDGVVNPVDLGIIRAFFFGPPGPSALAP